MSDVFQELSRKYGLNAGSWEESRLYEEEDAPCFLRIASTDSRMTPDEIAAYLPACAAETIGTVILSVTERELNYQLWLDEAAKVAGATITEGRSINHGGYMCYLIAIPGTAKN